MSQWYELNKGKRLAGPFQIWENAVAAVMMITGIFFFAAGTYTSIQSIVTACTPTCAPLEASKWLTYFVPDATNVGIKAPFSSANSGFPFVVYNATLAAMNQAA